MGVSTLVPLAKLSVAQTVAAIHAGRLDAVSVTKAALGRIASDNPRLNALVSVDAEHALTQARYVDERLAAGDMLPLAGVTVAIKDLIWVEGKRVTQGSRLFRDFRAPADAAAVERLKRAGAIIVGMANTSEFGCKGVTTNLLFGATRHHLDPSLTPGGSSGGPAVAVAANLVPLALGTDSGGSTRRPAAHTGVVGFKPTRGSIPDGPGFDDPVPGLSVIAPIARSVMDVSLVFDVLSENRVPHLRGASDPEHAIAQARRSRVAFSPRLGLQVPVDQDVLDATAAAIERIERLGVTVERMDPIWPAGVSEHSVMPLQHAGLANLFAQRWSDEPDIFDPDIAHQISIGRSLEPAAVEHAQAVSSDLVSCVAAFFRNFDFLLCPTTPCVAWPLTELGPSRIDETMVNARAHAVFTPFFNHANAPAISIPCGRGRAGLPVGLQIVGPSGSDRAVLDFALAIENACALTN